MSLCGGILGVRTNRRLAAGPGSATGKDSTKSKPPTASTAEDGSITCDTKVVNPAGNTKARPYYNPFND